MDQGDPLLTVQPSPTISPQYKKMATFHLQLETSPSEELGMISRGSMDIYIQAAFVIRLRLEIANLNYSRTLADIERLEAGDTSDPAVLDQLWEADTFIERYQTVWGARVSASAASANGG